MISKHPIKAEQNQKRARMLQWQEKKRKIVQATLQRISEAQELDA